MGSVFKFVLIALLTTSSVHAEVSMKLVDAVFHCREEGCPEIWEEIQYEYEEQAEDHIEDEEEDDVLYDYDEDDVLVEQ